jgi:hypothetical protein
MRDLSDSPLSVTLKSVRFRDSAIFATSVTLPILMDVISELCNSIVTRNTPNRIKMRPKKPLLNTIERFMLYCGIMTIPITAFLDPDTANLGNIYQCLRRSRTILVFGAVVTSLGRYDKKFWSPTITYALLAFLISGATTGSFSDNSNVGSRQEMGLETVKWLYLATALTFFSCNGFWLYTNLPHFFKMMWRGKESQSGEKLESQSEQQYRIFPLLYATATSLFFLGSMVSSRHYGEEDNYGADALFLHNLMFILYLLLQMYMSERMLKCEVVEGLVRSRSPPFSPLPSLPFCPLPFPFERMSFLILPASFFELSIILVDCFHFHYFLWCVV